MVNENPIHVRLEYNEAIQVKKDILNYQLSLLKIAKIINKYKEHHTKESELKETLLKKMRELKVAFGQMQKELPKPKIPQILKGNYPETTARRTTTKSTKSKGMGLEEQLKEIQNRLNELQNRRG